MAQVQRSDIKFELILKPHYGVELWGYCKYDKVQKEISELGDEWIYETSGYEDHLVVNYLNKVFDDIVEEGRNSSYLKCCFEDENINDIYEYKNVNIRVMLYGKYKNPKCVYKKYLSDIANIL